jgi:hypothetical protein
VRASDLIRCPAYDRAGRLLGTVVDLVAEPDPPGMSAVVAVIVSPHRHGRLLGYMRGNAQGPWLLRQITRVLARGTHTLAWHDVRIADRTQQPGG